MRADGHAAAAPAYTSSGTWSSSNDRLHHPSRDQIPTHHRAMRRILCKSKIHRATLTGAELNYEGSLTVDRALMDAADMRPYERVQVVNVNNGARLETYLIPGAPNSGTVQLNGAGARLGAPGDIVILMTYAEYDDDELTEGFTPTVVLVDAQNRVRPPEI
jgi:aspartate 1-decarboxylase